MRDQAYDLNEDETRDSLILGGLELIQPKEGYRFSLDAVLLAHFPELTGVERVVDLGTGSGVIPLLLTVRAPQVKIIGVELQAAMVERARRSVRLNGLQDRIEILHADIREIDKSLPGGSAALVLSNPPFWKKGEGHVNRHPEQALARHELQLNLAELVSQGAYLLAPEGKLVIIQRAARLEESLEKLRRNHLTPTRLRMVHARLDRQAGLVLLEAVKSRRGRLTILPPLVIYAQAGIYSPEIQAIYGVK
ncbi:MAG: tRNA1(Val) (adenine(37)-N6)-methyltransferase [Firmicutes bacterium]|nr:tRNA1(Val) (adenine(37)-N6)-methyltransferase [Bacillota bacterium]